MNASAENAGVVTSNVRECARAAADDDDDDDDDVEAGCRRVTTPRLLSRLFGTRPEIKSPLFRSPLLQNV